MNFYEASERFEYYRWLHHSGHMEKEKFVDFCRRLIVIDRRGLQWTIHPDDGNWYFSDGKAWARGAPDYSTCKGAARRPGKIRFWRYAVNFLLGTLITAEAGWLVAGFIDWINRGTFTIGGSTITFSPILLWTSVAVFSLVFGLFTNWILGKLILNNKVHWLVTLLITIGILVLAVGIAAGYLVLSGTLVIQI